jgi:hypothetical protein
MRALLLAALVLVAGAASAAAEDRVVGRWVLDEPAFRAQVERFYAAAIAEVPAAEQEQAEQFVDQAVEATVARMAGAAATFEPDGTVMLQPADGRPQKGSWSREGDTIVLQPAVDTAEAVRMIGTFEDGNLELTPDQENAVGFLMRPAE